MIKSYKPHTTLQDVIKEYYFLAMDVEEAQQEIPVVDDCCHDIIFFREENARLQYGGPPQDVAITHAVFTILGLTPPYKLIPEDHLTFFTIKVQPWMNRYFFGDVACTGIVNLAAAFPGLDAVAQALKNDTPIKQLLEIADTCFKQRDLTFTPAMLFVKAICEFVIAKQGIVKVKDLSLHFNRSRQYITKTFRQEVMCNVKTFSTSVRIVALIKQKAKAEALSLTQLTYDFGYFDQAHFINDFKKVCGVTPGYYFAHLPEFIQRHQ